jgi:MFS family permease
MKTVKDPSLNGFSKLFLLFVPFWAFLTFFKFGSGLHYTILAPLGERVFPIWLVGLLVGLAALVQLLLDVPAGYILDRYGYKKLLQLATLLFMIAPLFLLFGLSKTTFLLTLVASIFGWLFFSPGTNAYIMRQSPEKLVGRFISTKDIFASIGIVLASIAVVFVVSLDVRIIGLLLLVILFLAYAAITFAPNDNFMQRAELNMHKKSSRLKKSFFIEAFHVMKRYRPASILLMSLSFSAAAFYGIIWFVVPLLIAHSVHNGVLGLGLGIFDFSVVILGFALGKLVDSSNKKLLILLGLLVFSVAGIFIGTNFGILFLLLGFLATAGDELAGLSLWAWLYGIDKEHESYGLISGTISLFEDLGWTVGPILAGVFYSLWGPTLTIAVGGILIFCNIILFLIFVKHPLPNMNGLLPLKPHRHRHKH